MPDETGNLLIHRTFGENSFPLPHSSKAREVTGAQADKSQFPVLMVFFVYNQRFFHAFSRVLSVPCGTGWS